MSTLIRIEAKNRWTVPTRIIDNDADLLFWFGGACESSNPARLSMSDMQHRRGAPIRSISAVVPVHNAAAGLQSLVESLVEQLGDQVPDYQIILLENGSSDGTPRIAAEVASHYDTVTLIRHQKQIGIGACMREGIELSSKQFVLLLDGAGDYDPADLASLAQWGDAYDAVIGFRATRQSLVDAALISPLSRAFTRLLVGVSARDIACDLMLVRASVLKQVTLFSTSAAFRPELRLRLFQHSDSVREVPVHFRPRHRSRRWWSTLNDYRRTARELLALRHRIRREKQAAIEATQSAGPDDQ